MKETVRGVVVRWRPGRAEIEIATPDHCGACRACTGFAASPVRVTVVTDKGVRPGAVVFLEHATTPFRAVLLLLVLPLLLFLMGSWCGWRIGLLWSWEPAITAAVSGSLLLALAWLAAARASRRAVHGWRISEDVHACPAVRPPGTDREN